MYSLMYENVPLLPPLHTYPTPTPTVYMGSATILKKPVWLLVTPPLVRSMSGLTGWPIALSRSP